MASTSLEKPPNIPASATSSPYSITESILQERLNQPIYGHVGRQIYAGVLACLASFSFGTILGWSHSISLEVNAVKTALTHSDICLLISLVLLGCSFGVTSCTLLMKQMGPKKVLVVIGPFYILNWWLTLMPEPRLQMAGRFFLGFLGVTYANSADTLVLQTVHVGIRKYVFIIQDSTMAMGVLMSRIVGTATSRYWLTVICAIIPMVHYVLIQIVPESPVFLYANSHRAAAKSLRWYRGKDNFYEDMAHIKTDWDAARQDSDAYRYMLLSRVVYRSLSVVLVVTALQILSGYFVFMFFSLDVLTQRVMFTPVVDASIAAAFYVVARIFWGTLHMKHPEWKVRGFLISSCFLTGICLALLAVFVFLDDVKETKDLIEKLSWVPMLIIPFYLFFCDMGLNHYPRILIYEYMPCQMYKRATNINQTAFWLLAFINIFTFAKTFNAFIDCYIYGGFAITMFLGTIFCYIFVVEPRGKSLIQIQLEFGGNPAGRRSSLYMKVKQTL